jgi:hypothetical protein
MQNCGLHPRNANRDKMHSGRGGQGMFTLLFAAREKVMLTRYSGVFSSDDISALDEFVAGFVAREGHYVRSIFDFTAVKAIAVPRPKLLERGRRARMNPDQDRVVVAPQEEIYEIYCDYAQGQLDIGNGKLMVVRTLPEALRLLGLSNPDFQPLIVASSPIG